MNGRFYHRTNAEAAAAILSGGFRDGRRWISDLEIVGVWISEFPLDSNEGAGGHGSKSTVLLAIDCIDEASIAEFEIVEEEKPYREWCVPAQVLNARPVSAVNEENEPSRFDGIDEDTIAKFEISDDDDDDPPGAQ